MRESQIEKLLVARVRAEGGLTRKARWLCRRGAPDRYVSFPGGVAAWVEVKRPGVTEPDPHQQREMDRLRAHGHLVALVHSAESVDRLVAELKEKSTHAQTTGDDVR